MSSKIAAFKQTLNQHRLGIQRPTIDMIQVNIGKRCNQACHHCHVEAGPNRRENMDKATIDRLLFLLIKAPDIHTVDITGGAPELNPHFRYFVEQIRHMGKAVIDRCNLTVLFEPDQEDTAEFLKAYQVQIISSLPCYSQKNVDKQRGRGVFNKSIKALKQLNQLGYGDPNTQLILNLVYNPVGAFLPPPQASLEQAYKQRLKTDFDIVFNHLLSITNMPINRFRHFLELTEQYENYMQLLVSHFNPDTIKGLMCRNLISIGWDGIIYDCDFNQMLDIPVGQDARTIWEINHFSDCLGDVCLGNHCYGCTAGSGSSCGGTLT